MGNKKVKKVTLVDGQHRDPKRIERIMNLINAIWTLRPESRFTQLLANLKTINFNNFYLEDDELEKDLANTLAVIKQMDKEKEDKYKLEHKKLP